MFRCGLDARSMFLQLLCVCMCVHIYWHGLSLWVWVLPVCFTDQADYSVAMTPLDVTALQAGQNLHDYELLSQIKLLPIKFRFQTYWGLKTVWVETNFGSMWLCHVFTKRPKKKGEKKKLRPFPFPTIYLWTDRFLSQECSLSLFPDGIQYDQWECVFVKLPTLRPTSLLSPIRPVKSRVWQRRRGPICSPCWTTLSG